MKPAMASPTQEALAGLVERVTFHNAENGFCVLRTKARGHRELVTVVGHSATIAAGEWITATGEWVNDWSRTARCPCCQAPRIRQLTAPAALRKRPPCRQLCCFAVRLGEEDIMETPRDTRSCGGPIAL